MTLNEFLSELAVIAGQGEWKLGPAERIRDIQGRCPLEAVARGESGNFVGAAYKLGIADALTNRIIYASDFCDDLPRGNKQLRRRLLTAVGLTDLTQ